MYYFPFPLDLPDRAGPPIFSLTWYYSLKRKEKKIIDGLAGRLTGMLA